MEIIANQKLTGRLLSLVALMLLVVSVTSLGIASAHAPLVTVATADVDGNPGEWDLTEAGNDYFAPMYNGGNPTKALVANCYMRYNTLTHTVYVLVLTTAGYPGLSTGYESSAWVAQSTVGDSNVINDKVVVGTSGDDGVPPDFAWVGPGFDGVAGHVQGYEASWTLMPGDWMVIVHIEVLVPPAGTGATVGFMGKGGMLLSLPPTPVIPELPLGTIAGVAAPLLAVAIYKKKK